MTISRRFLLPHFKFVFRRIRTWDMWHPFHLPRIWTIKLVWSIVLSPRMSSTIKNSFKRSPSCNCIQRINSAFACWNLSIVKHAISTTWKSSPVMGNGSANWHWVCRFSIRTIMCRSSNTISTMSSYERIFPPALIFFMFMPMIMMKVSTLWSTIPLSPARLSPHFLSKSMFRQGSSN